MKAWEMLLSESQERMLVVIKKGEEQGIIDIFTKWDIHCVQIGEVTKEPILKFYMHDELVAEVPAESMVLGGGAPVYEREYTRPAYFDKIEAFDSASIPVPSDLLDVAKQLANLPSIASKRWVYEQYDSMVGIGTTNTNAPSDASVIRLHNTEKALAATTDCNSRYVFADPYKGGMIAVSEAARNLVCSGATPVAITNCLNFGNPYIPEVYWQFVSAIKGMSSACTKFETPVTGGNVSFYNQSSDEGPVFPTPTIGMLGILDTKSSMMTLDFKNVGDAIYLIGESKNDISSSEYLYSYHKIKSSPAPFFDLAKEYDTHQFIKQLIQSHAIVSAHDVADGGLFITLMESAMSRNLGFEIESEEGIRKDAFLFGEAQGRIVVSVPEAKQAEFIEIAATSAIEYTLLGTVSAGDILIDEQSFGHVSKYKSSFETSLEKTIESN
jgi:phosphoribosylformylglycinamidine synthase